MDGIIAFKLVDGKYEIIASGVGVVLNVQADKVLPVREEVAKQPEKLYYDGVKLRLKKGQRLLSLEELNAENEAHDLEMSGTIYDEDSEIVEVEM